jgi:hypothetical protein
MPPPATEDVTSDGTPAGSYVTAVTTFYAALYGISTVIGGTGTTSLIYVIFNKKSGGFTAITQYRVNAKFGTQRRRGYYKVPRHKKKA